MADVGVFSRYKGFGDFQAEAKKNSLQDALLTAKLAATMKGTDLPAPLQLANEYQKRMQAGDTEGANTLAAFAKTFDKGIIQGPDGNYYVAGGYAPSVGELAQAKGYGQQLGKDTVRMQSEPIIAAGKANATNASNLNYKPKIEAATATATTDAAGNINDSTVDPLIQQLTEYNSKSFSIPYSGAIMGVSRVFGGKETQEKVTNTDLMKQARLDMAAPLAKQLGVNPTDKDFQASLDRIFNLDASQASRQAQIEALGQRIAQRKAARASRGVNDLFGTQAPDTDFRATLSKPSNPAEAKKQFNDKKKPKGLTPAEQEELNQLRARFKK